MAYLPFVVISGIRLYKSLFLSVKLLPSNETDTKALEKEFERRYKKETEVRGKKCFAVREDEFFIVSGLSWANAIVLEHAFSKTEVEKNMFEDGKLFYMEEMNEKEMFEKMIEEIEG